MTLEIRRDGAVRLKIFLSLPAFHNIESYCEIISLDKMNKYFKDLHRWEKEKKRQEDEFTIDDSKHHPPHAKLIETLE